MQTYNRLGGIPMDATPTGPASRATEVLGRDGWRVAIAIALATFAAFQPAADNRFVNWDDAQNFVLNEDWIGLGPGQVRWAWSTRLLGVYQPLSWMILEAQSAAWGLDPGKIHLVSILLHAVGAMILYALIVRLIELCDPEPARERPRAVNACAGLSAALFAVHPLRVEAVAWASCQPYLPSILLAMLAVLVYLGPRGEGPGAIRLVASWVLFALALLCKAVPVSLPAVLLILDVYPLRRLRRGSRDGGGPSPARVLLEKVPFVALSLVFIAVAIRAKAEDNALATLTTSGPSSRLAQASLSVWFYLGKTIWPSGLSAYYPLNDRVALGDPACLAGALGVIAISAGLVFARRRHPALLAVWASYLVMLAPNSGLVRIGNQLAADRYSYFASIGLFALFAGALCRLSGWPQRVARPIGFALTAVAILACIPSSRALTETWHDSESLWTRCMATTGNDSIFIQLAMGMSQVGQPGKSDSASAYFERARQAAARNGDGLNIARALNGLGLVANLRGRPDEAKAFYREALRFDPGHADVHGNLGVVLHQQGRLEEARRHFAEVSRLQPGSARAGNDLGIVLLEQGRTEEAKAEFVRVLAGHPDDPDAHANLASALEREGRGDEARRESERASWLSARRGSPRPPAGGAPGQAGRPPGGA